MKLGVRLAVESCCDGGVGVRCRRCKGVGDGGVFRRRGWGAARRKAVSIRGAGVLR